MAAVQRNETMRSLTFVIGDPRQLVRERSTGVVALPMTHAKTEESIDSRDLEQNHHKPNASKPSAGITTWTASNQQLLLDESGNQLTGLALERAIFRSRHASKSTPLVHGTLFDGDSLHDKTAPVEKQNIAQEHIFFNTSSPDRLRNLSEETSVIGEERSVRHHRGRLRRRASTNCVPPTANFFTAETRLGHCRPSVDSLSCQNLPKPPPSDGKLTKNIADSPSLRAPAAPRVRDRWNGVRRHTVPDVQSHSTSGSDLFQANDAGVELHNGSALDITADEKGSIQAARRRILWRLSRAPEPETVDVTTVTGTEPEERNDGSSKSRRRKPRKLNPLVTITTDKASVTPVGNMSSCADVTGNGGNNDSVSIPLLGRRGKALLPGVGK